MVEDNVAARQAFGKVLHAYMPDVILVEAGSVPEAERLVEDSTAKGRPFDAVILDCHLPTRHGTHEMNTSLCSFVSTRQVDTLIVHCSQYIKGNGGGDLDRHIQAEHAEWPGPRTCIVPKEMGWDQALLQRLATDRVDTRLSRSFAPAPGGSASHGFRGDGTRRLAQLMADIEKFWPLLHEKTRQKVQQHFSVSVSGASVTVTPGGSRA